MFAIFIMPTILISPYMQLFEVPTNHFSLGSVPLVYQVIPALVDLKEALERIQNTADISPVTRVGAQAALNVFNKYMATMTICEVYFIAIGTFEVLYFDLAALLIVFCLQLCVQISSWIGFENTTTKIPSRRSAQCCQHASNSPIHQRLNHKFYPSIQM
jgi:hypothetical protein